MLAWSVERNMDPLRMLTPRSSLALELDSVRRNLVKSAWIYIAETSRCGLGIFAAKPFYCNDVIVFDEDSEYYDGSLNYLQVQALGLDLSRDCFQVDVDRFLLPRGSIDDLINHSCNPNAGIRLMQNGYRLIALRDIERGQEITYDYATYIDSPERLLCCCGESCCRKEIGRFRELTPTLRAHYLDRGVVGAFAAEAAAVEGRLVESGTA